MKRKSSLFLFTLVATNLFASSTSFDYSNLNRELELKNTTIKNKELCPSGMINFLKEKNILLFGSRISIDTTQINGPLYLEKSYCDFEIQVKNISDQKNAILAIEKITTSKNCEDKNSGGIVREKFIFGEKETNYIIYYNLKNNKSEFRCIY